MTKKKAIEKARREELEHVVWAEEYQAWWERNRALNRSELKTARILNAAVNLGFDFDRAQYIAVCEQDMFDGYTFRQAVAAYNRATGKFEIEGVRQ